VARYERNYRDLETKVLFAKAKRLYLKHRNVIIVADKLDISKNQALQLLANIKSKIKCACGKEFSFRLGKPGRPYKKCPRCRAKITKKPNKITKKKSNTILKIKKKALKLCKNTTLTYTKIANKLKVSFNTIKNWCYQFPRPRGRPSDPKKQIAIKLCKQGYSSVTIANKLQVSLATVRRWCPGFFTSATAKAKRRLPQRKKYTKADVLFLARKNKHMSSSELARKTLFSQNTVIRWLKSAGLGGVRVKQGPGKRLTKALKKQILSMHRKKISFKKIAKKLDVNRATVSRICKTFSQ